MPVFFFYFIWTFDTQGIYGSHSKIIGELGGVISILFRGPNCKSMQFCAVADIYMAKK